MVVDTTRSWSDLSFSIHKVEHCTYNIWPLFLISVSISPLTNAKAWSISVKSDLLSTISKRSSWRHLRSHCSTAISFYDREVLYLGIWKSVNYKEMLNDAVSMKSSWLHMISKCDSPKEKLYAQLWRKYLSFWEKCLNLPAMGQFHEPRARPRWKKCMVIKFFSSKNQHCSTVFITTPYHSGSTSIFINLISDVSTNLSYAQWIVIL